MRLLPQEPSRNLAYVYVNEGDVYSRPDGSKYSYVTVVDTNTQKVLRVVRACSLVVGQGLLARAHSAMAYSEVVSIISLKGCIDAKPRLAYVSLGVPRSSPNRTARRVPCAPTFADDVP